MKKRYLMILQLIVMLVVGCSHPDRSVVLSSEKLGGISLDDRFADTDTDIEKRQSIDGVVMYRCNNGLKVGVDNRNEIQWVELSAGAGKELSTAKGIKINATKSSLTQSYGAPTGKRHEQGAEIYVYADKQNAIKLEFWSVDQHIHMIRLMRE
ncbi:hypothetical protein [Paenibacillus sp. MMS18-CY102]|uniref:hypothetical protein n=1 Tax=Paenibacillus sp. MMS18-CY102 TaxID=2682849 RepID=UPI001365C5F0|nr:hypothetical protein [Paenibacillus sp. MMS18-CY102]MWC27733.1 hypothetical protein [Paenibacillus sp. MMS18-CY102]